MSPTSCRCSTPRLRLYPPPSGPPGRASVRGRCGRSLGRWARWKRGRRGRGRHEVHPFLRTGIPAEPSLLFVRGAGCDGLDVSVIALVLLGDQGVLPMKVGNLLGQLVAEIGLLGVCVQSPHGRQRENDDQRDPPESVGARTRDAGGGQRGGVSHGGSSSGTPARGKDAEYNKGAHLCRRLSPCAPTSSKARPAVAA